MKFNYYKNLQKKTTRIISFIGTMLIISFVLVPLDNVVAERMTSGNYTLQSDSINFEGARSTSGSYRLEDTGGEVATGDSSSSNNNLHAGFQQANVVAATPTPTSTTPVTTNTSTSGSVPSPVNVLNFTATPLEKSIALSWIYPENSLTAAVRIVRSDKFFPNDISDGEVIFEGTGNAIIDNDVKIGTRYYYALFSRNAAGEYSSGVLAQARIAPPGDLTPPVKPGDIFENIIPSTITDPAISGLSLLDFDFIQNGRKLAQVQGTVAVDGKENLTIRLNYNKVPEILKTIAITLADPQDESRVFTFLLRVNKDKTAYEATIAPLGRSGDYKLDAIILDYKNQGLKRLNGNIKALILADAQSLFNGKNDSMLSVMIILLILAFIMILIFVLIERRKKNKEKEQLPLNTPK